VTITLGLLAAGACVGGGIGVGLLGVFALAIDGPGGFPYVWDAFVLAGVVGALLGALLGPLIAWLALRDVPLWRVFAETAIGAVVGGAAGFVGSGFHPIIAVGAAALGVVGAAVRLRVRTRQLPRGLPLNSREDR
jgi:hypothetical protein